MSYAQRHKTDSFACGNAYRNCFTERVRHERQRGGRQTGCRDRLAHTCEEPVADAHTDIQSWLAYREKPPRGLNFNIIL